MDAADPASMFEASFYNAETRRLWHTEHWYPLKMMRHFWEMDPKTVRWMFDDLFNETKEVEGRIGRFLFGCDELLRDYKATHVTSIENNHYHGDFRMIGLYLAFRYPEAYGPYDFEAFRKTLMQLGARDIPQENDLGRYAKVLRTLMVFLEKEPAIATAFRKLLVQPKYFQGKTLLVAADFCTFIGSRV